MISKILIFSSIFLWIIPAFAECDPTNCVTSNVVITIDRHCKEGWSIIMIQPDNSKDFHRDDVQNEYNNSYPMCVAPNSLEEPK